MKNWWVIEKKGFTLVELLIVIVVIAILAAISIVAYNGIQRRADLSSAQSSVNGIGKTVELFKVDNNVYPVSIADCPSPAATNICFNAQSNLTYRYTATNTGLNPSYEVGVMANSEFQYSSNAEKTGANEFLQYTDMAPYIDKYGLVKYQIDFDIKSASIASASTVNVYQQNGSGSKYCFGQSVPVTTSYVHQTIVVTPTLCNGSLTQSILAFYGTYGTGNIPSVRNVRIQLAL